jgi:hypothetical protein
MRSRISPSSLNRPIDEFRHRQKKGRPEDRPLPTISQFQRCQPALERPAFFLLDGRAFDRPATIRWAVAGLRRDNAASKFLAQHPDGLREHGEMFRRAIGASENL